MKKVKKQYEYFSPFSYKRVTIPKSSFVKKILCEHEWVCAAKHEIHGYEPVAGRIIQFYCVKCGKLGNTEFQYWNH